MSVANAVERSLDERPSRSALLVLGMHRSGTSAITGSLGLCGAWVGDETELTGANVENPRGFWERRDTRQICDRLLQTAGADWWKIATFELETIPHAVLVEERTKFAKVVSTLDERGTWVLKEPRLCLLLPVLRDCVADPVCIHIFRNPLEVARSLQTRNGFGISAGLALWEAYNRRALTASENLPRLLVSHESLMLRPVETLDGLLERLAELDVSGLARPNEDRLTQFISPSLYRRRVTEEETRDYLSAPQRILWKQFCGDQDNSHEGGASISRATRQHLFDLESTERSLSHHRDRQRELNADLAARNRTIADLQRTTERLNAELERRSATIRTCEATIRTREATIRTREAAIRSRDARISSLIQSTSWRITAPLRALSRVVRWIRRNFGRVLRLVLWLVTGQFSRALGSVRFALAGPDATVHSNGGIFLATGTDSLSDLIRANRPKRSGGGGLPAGSVSGEAVTKVSVIAWDMGHNPLGRAYLLADVLRNDYEVDLIGANFPRFGSEIWEPLRNCSRVPLKCFPGGNFPAYFRTMEEVAEQVEGDVIYVSKPRLPSLELAILAKFHRNRPLILDIDDYELGFFGNREPLNLGDIRCGRATLDLDCPHDEAWTRYCESLIPLAERITVSNEELRRKYGGVILPHIRDEADFDPNAYPRNAIRRALGFAPDNKVILFAGTPRMHKGIAQLDAALRELNRPDYKLLVVGTPADGTVTQLVRHADLERVTLVPDVPFSDLPGYLCAGDLVCLLQDEREASSNFQMPAKFTDALAMGIPVLASNVPPLRNAAGAELVVLLGDASPARRIDEIFSNYAVYKEKADRNRQIFLKEYGYGTNLARLKEMIDGIAGNPNPIPTEFHELRDYHRHIFALAGDTPRTIPRVFPPSPPTDFRSAVDERVVRARSVRALRRNSRSYVDDQLDIVFFWKQNDTGIYGRRQDMLVKYLSKEPKVSRIFHFDAPINFFRSAGVASKSAPAGRYSHGRLVLWQTLRRKLGLANTKKVRFDTFIFATRRRIPGLLNRVLPSEGHYVEFLRRCFRRHDIGRRRTIFWVCPNDFYFPAIEEFFDADLVIADVIDDQRKWEISPEYRDDLSRNYREVLQLSDLVFVNCHTVLESMSPYSDNVNLLPNAVELLEEEARHWPKPRELERLEGPIVGYVGNLDIARIDLDLLRALAKRRPEWNLVFIGSMHNGEEIRELEEYGNVSFLGVRVYEQAVRYIRHFDVAIIPHLDNELTRSMNPLKLYVYQSLRVPVVSTSIANIDDFREFTHVASTPDEFMKRIDDCLGDGPDSNGMATSPDLLRNNSWPERVNQVMGLVDEALATRESA